eukprot:scaffold4061_cov344-Prasinococcus_capsulatus_cf.AAC.6
MSAGAGKSYEALLDLQVEATAWDEWEADDEFGGKDASATRSLFAPERVFPSPEAALAHDALEHGFDYVAFREALKLSYYSNLQCINFIRSRVQAGDSDVKRVLLEAFHNGGPRVWEQEQVRVLRVFPVVVKPASGCGSLAAGYGACWTVPHSRHCR